MRRVAKPRLLTASLSDKRRGRDRLQAGSEDTESTLEILTSALGGHRA